ncbi:transporter [Klebsiella grimontii]|uniref:Transporter n=1 Tax=Klebsiella grimontii TaxID=2058152 RepID=A0A7H4NXC5_9ENTR|nr:transporter [Klebsiella grimontii]
MEMSFIASFWLVSFLLIITPGADWAYTISAGINGRRVIPAVAGLMSGHLLATLIVVAGIGVLIAGHPLALSTITLLGAGYLDVAGDRCFAPSANARQPAIQRG